MAKFINCLNQNPFFYIEAIIYSVNSSTHAFIRIS